MSIVRKPSFNAQPSVIADRDSIKVAVRVRPFNARYGISLIDISQAMKAFCLASSLVCYRSSSSDRERDSGPCIVTMMGKSTQIRDPSNASKEPRTVTFDYSYWSHDGFTETPEGLLVPSSSYVLAQCTMEP